MNTTRLPDAPSTTVHAAPERRDASLHALLDESLTHPPEYGEGLSSHLPMALAALHGLGADEAQLRRFAASYLRRSGLALRRIERLPAVALADRQALHGQVDAFPALQSHFASALQGRGRDAVLQETLPSLLPGVAGAAFHGLIRTAHAVEAGHDGELAAALAYWAARWMPLPPGDDAAASVPGVTAWLAAVEASLEQHDAGWRSGASLITGRMADATRTASYRSLAAGPRSDAAPGRALLALARHSARRYLQTGNFTVLHMATAMRAALVLVPWCPAASHPSAMAAVWRSFLAARIASAAGPTPAAPCGTAPTPPWDQIRAAACQSDTDHTLKLVHAMAWLAQHAESAGEGPADAVWAAAAWRALRPTRA